MVKVQTILHTRPMYRSMTRSKFGVEALSLCLNHWTQPAQNSASRSDRLYIRNSDSDGHVRLTRNPKSTDVVNCSSS